uniref:Ubiquitin-like-conjugating enzyme ATG10 n=1 Tax=Neolamprologus brichardi TaxID=32507 RepID=A0A3Q4GTC1_NEOBR
MSVCALNEKQFFSCCQLLLQQSEHLRDGWSWEAVQVRRPLNLNVDEQPGPVVATRLHSDGITGDGGDEDDAVCVMSEGSSHVLQYEYHILYSCSYSQLPVGRSVMLEDVWSSVHPNFRRCLQNSPLTAITQQEHPLLGQPFFMLHPCRTEEFLRPVLQEEQPR